MKYVIYFLLIPLFSFSQKLSFHYDVSYRLDTKNLKDVTYRTMILDIENKRSIFREEIDKKNDSLEFINKNGINSVGIENQFYVKKDLAEKKIDKIISFQNNNYALPIDEKLEWNILTEKKIIGNYKTQKAEVQYAGRSWIAWFTTELPYHDGPYIFSGLPGLIVEIEDINRDYSFKLAEVKKLNGFFDVKTELTPINWTQYENLAKSYYNDPFNVNSKSGKKITFTDAYGKQMNLAEITKSTQKSIIKNNNPIELNHKVTY